MKNGERRATLTAMARTIVELDSDLELKRRESADLRNESMKVSHLETVVKELENKVKNGNEWRSGMQRDIVGLESKLRSSNEINAHLEKRLNQMMEKLAEREYVKSIGPIVIESSDFGRKFHKYKDAIKIILTLCEDRNLASQRRIEKIITICEEALK